MKKAITLIFILSPFTLFSQNLRYINKAQKYCEILGYSTSINPITYAESVKLPNGDVVDIWDFYRGKVGNEFSYCEKKGYKLKVKKIVAGNMSYRYSICYDKITGLGKTQKSVMYENGDYEALYTGAQPPPEPGDTIPPVEIPDPPDPPNVDPGEPIHFSWEDQMQPVRHQGNTAACTAFAATGVAEWVYYHKTGDLLDFSEAFIAFNGPLSYPLAFLYNNGALELDYPFEPLKMITREGTILESDFVFPGNPLNPQPDEYLHDRYRFHSWAQVTGTINEIKDVLRERGPLYAHCSTEDWDDEECWPELASGGYVSLTDTSVCVPRRVGNCVNTQEFNHAVIIVGYGYDGGEGGAGDFWIVRNTLGPTYGHEGHIFVKATHSMLTCRLAYLRWENPSIVGEYWVEEGETNNYQVVHSQTSVSQFQWILSPSSLFNNQESGYDRSIDLIPNDNSSGLGNIAFTLSYPVGWENDPKKTEALDKDIWIGQPFMPVITCTTQDPCASIKTYEVGDKLLNGAQDVIWSDDPPYLTFVEPTDIVNVRHVQILGEGCKYRVKIAQVHRLKTAQLSDIKVSFLLTYANSFLPGKGG